MFRFNLVQGHSYNKFPNTFLAHVIVIFYSGEILTLYFRILLSSCICMIHVWCYQEEQSKLVIWMSQ